MSDEAPAVPGVRRYHAYLCASAATVLWLGAILGTLPFVTLWKAGALGDARSVPAGTVALVRFHDALRGGLLVWLPLWLAVQLAVVLVQHPRVPKALRLGLLVGASVIPGLAAALLILALALLAAA